MNEKWGTEEKVDSELNSKRIIIFSFFPLISFAQYVPYVY